MSLWERLKSAWSSDRSLPDGLGDAGQPSAVEYVNWLLQHMLRTSCTELTIDTARSLPHVAAEDKGAGPPCIPPHRTVLNRLKLLSGLNPGRQLDVREGSFEVVHASYVLVVGTRFEDDADRSRCTLRLRVRTRNA